jgi:hypothetical protein
MQLFEEVFQREGYQSSGEVLRSYAIMIALTKIEQFRSECKFFEEKYGMNLMDFNSRLHQVTETEDFKKEEDFDDWEFSQDALEWWEHKLRELKNVAYS